MALSVSWLAEAAEAIAVDAPELATLQWVATDALQCETDDAWTPPTLDTDYLAL